MHGWIEEPVQEWVGGYTYNPVLSTSGSVGTRPEAKSHQPLRCEEVGTSRARLRAARLA